MRIPIAQWPNCCDVPVVDLQRFCDLQPDCHAQSTPLHISQATEVTAQLEDWQLAGDVGRRYGMLSGDINPIHLHPATSRLFGFARPIAHALLLMARCEATLRAHGVGMDGWMGVDMCRVQGAVFGCRGVRDLGMLGRARS
jgi:acyl dehydratase